MQREKPGTLPGFPSLTIGPRGGREPMAQQPFSLLSQSVYMLGKDLNLLPFELFNHVKAGRLHPFDKDTGQPIPRPDVQRTKDRHKKTIDEIKTMSLKGGKIDALYRGQKKEEEKRKLDSLIKELQKEHDAIVKEIETITAIDDWTTYDPPEEPKHLITHLPIDLMKAFDILQNACFHKNEIIKLGLNVETPFPAQEEPGSMPPKSPATIEESAPAPVNEVVFSYMSPTEVMVKCGNKRAASHDQLSLGFKKVKNPKAWNAFLEILKSGNPSFSFGKSGTKYNDNSRKMFEFINDKLVVFLNKKMKMHLPQDFKLYEKNKTAGTGIYKFNFRIGKYNTNSIGVEDLLDDKLMANIKKCLTEQEKLNRTRRGDKAAEIQSEEIRERIIPLLTEAHTRKLIDDKGMQTYLNQLNPPEHD